MPGNLVKTCARPTNVVLKGLFFWNKRTIPGFQQAIDYFQQAIAKDRNYAPAYTGLANSYSLLTGYNSESGSTYMPQARAAALRALEIDANLAEAHTALALVVQNYDWDWQTAEKEFRRAAELNPNYATAHHWYAEHLMWRGRFEEALVESERARQLDPLSLIVAADNGEISYCSRQYDRAIEEWRSVQQMDPDFSRARMIMRAYVERGMFASALAEAEKERSTNARAPWYWMELTYVYGRAGQQENARRAFDKVQRLNHRQKLDPAALAVGYLGLNNKEQALASLEEAYRLHSVALVALKVEPAFDPLRADPRFQALIHQVGLQ